MGSEVLLDCGNAGGLMRAFKTTVPQLLPKHPAFPIMVLPEHA
jgi:hypothetical protein